MDERTARTVLEALEGTRATELRDDLYRHCVRYARLRTDWARASVEERREMDERRQLAHTALIDACNILSRAMHRAGEEITWRAAMGDDRRRIGDFACYLHAFLGLRAR